MRRLLSSVLLVLAVLAVSACGEDPNVALCVEEIAGAAGGSDRDAQFMRLLLSDVNDRRKYCACFVGLALAAKGDADKQQKATFSIKRVDIESCMVDAVGCRRLEEAAVSLAGGFARFKRWPGC